MAEIVRKTAEPLSEVSPARMMRELMRWDPFREMAPLLRTFAPFERVERLEWSPSFDISENKDAYVFKADVPGVKQEDLEITATDNRIQVSGKRDIEEETTTETAYTYERQYGSFCRAFTLPAGADLEHAKSELKDGVLTLVIPKKPGAQAKKIPIGSAKAKA